MALTLTSAWSQDVASANASANANANANANTNANVDVDVWLHTVQPGDTLIGLQGRLLRPDADWREVQRLNRIANPRRLQPASILRIPLQMLLAQPVEAEVLHRHGEVWLERQGQAQQALQGAARLQTGDVVVTGVQSSVTLRFADGSRTQLGPNGRLRLDRLMRLGSPQGSHGTVETQLRLQTGSAESQVVPQRPAPRFELRTPAVNLGVRGTDFRGRVDAERTWVEVVEGRVAANAQPVAAGFGAVATAQGVTPPRPLLPAPDLDALPERLQRLPLQLAWPPAPGAARYRAQIVDTSVEPARLVLEGVFDQAQASWPDEPPDGRYELRVRAADELGIEGQTASRPFVLDARPQPPFPLRPATDEKLDAENTTLAWSRNPEATRYRVQVASDAEFKQPVFESQPLDDTKVAAALPIGRLHWRVASIRSDGKQGPWSDPRSFERIPPPPPAPASQPAKTSDAGIVIGWRASSLPGVKYQVQISRGENGADFAKLVVDEQVQTAEYLLAQPESGTYHVRIRTLGADGRAGPYGTPQLIEVPQSRWWLWLLPLVLLL